jgi:predicted NBD/HSP70 family sugar kinase
MKKLILSIDMGGTTAKIAVADKQGNILHKFVVKTK